MGLTNTFKDAALGVLDNTTFTGVTCVAAFLQTVTAHDTPTVAKCDYTGYSDTGSIDFTAVAASANGGGRKIDNSAALTGGQNTGTSQAAIAVGVYQSTNCYAIAFIDADAPVIATAATSDTWTAPAHGLSTDQTVRLDETVFGAFPTGPSENTTYYITNAATDTFTISTTQGGGTLDVTAAGVAAVMPFTPLTIGTNGTPQIAANALKIEI